MAKKILIPMVWCLLLGCQSKKSKPINSFRFEIGIVTDCQYCDCEHSTTRFYRKSPNKLRAAVSRFNNEKLDYTIHLGDFIDRDFKSFDTLIPIWNTLTSEKHHVLGNHDFNVADSLKPLVLNKMNLKQRYYSFVKNNWRFIVLDGNDLSYQGALSSKKKQQTDSLVTLLKPKNPPNLQTWNGGLGQEQLTWVQKELELAKRNHENVGFYCHFPVLGDEPATTLWNSKELLALIDKYPCVKFYFNGHNHNGSYVNRNGVHYLTFKGMVETENTTAYALATLTKDSIFIKGFGREPSRRLHIR